MCTSPSYVWVKRGAKWEQTPAPCDRCWSCRENYVSDWVGRCLCEASTSLVCCTLSLTYATPLDGRDLSHKVVQPVHFQNFMKRLRKAGHKIRYLVAGEYGDLYDRSHFHCILFFTKLMPLPEGHAAPKLMNRRAFANDHRIASPFCREVPHKDMCHIREWPHGHVEADWSMTEKAVRYVVKYFKGDDKKTSWDSMSKKPPLGAAWFAMKAAESRSLDVFPSTFEYLPPGGKPGKKYLMTGATRRDFLNAITKSRAARPRMTKWVAKTFDKLERQEYIDGVAWPPLPVVAPEPQWTENGKLLQSQRHARIAADAFEKERIDFALSWGFDDVEEFEAFWKAGGYDSPDYRGRPQYLQDRTGAAATRPRSAARGFKAPTRFDRQGKPVGPADREYLAGAYDRDGKAGSSEAGSPDLAEGLPEGTPDLE